MADQPQQRGQHRGPSQEDPDLFAASALPSLRLAVSELSYLLSRGYRDASALKLVGDRYALTLRQREAVHRCTCTDTALARRRKHQVDPFALMGLGRPLLIDGFNALTTIETALSGGVVLVGRDGYLRDIAGIHGSYRKIQETLPAISCVGKVAQALRIPRCVFYLDAPVSNSGRLKMAILEVAAREGWDFSVEVVADPDPILKEASGIIATADSQILDACDHAFPLALAVVRSQVAAPWIVDLRDTIDKP